VRGFYAQGATLKCLFVFKIANFASRGAVTLGNDLCNLSRNNEKPCGAARQVARGVLHSVMFLPTCLALDGDSQCRGLARLFYWLMPQKVATLHHA